MFSYFTLLLIFGDKLGGWTEGIIINVVAAILIGAVIWYYRRRRPPKELINSNFEIFRKKGKKLTPEDVLGIRADKKAGFLENFYFERDYDKIVMEKLREGKNVLIIGESLSGKTRLAYYVLKALGDCHVSIP